MGQLLANLEEAICWYSDYNQISRENL